ncbi:MAG: tetratricopeptide repeat protein [bacterium]
MNTHLGLHLRDCIRITLVFSLFSFVLTKPRITHSQELPEKDPQNTITYQSRLSFYLDQKSKTFLSDLAVKEKLLLQMIRNVTNELKSRGKPAVLDDHIGYQKLFGDADNLVAEYDQELNLLVGILQEVSHLQKVVDQTGDLTSWELLVDLREKALNALENRELYQRGFHNRDRVRSLVGEYTSEVDSVLSLHKRLLLLERHTGKQGDIHAQQVVSAQLDSINLLLGNFEVANSDSLTDYYLSELEMLLTALDELETLQARALRLDTDVSLEIEELRRSILSNLDSRMLALIGYDTKLPHGGVRVSDYFREWKAKQYTDYKLHFTQYQIMKKSLLKSATPSERSRMLEKDLLNAFINYVERNYELAEAQFDLIFREYGNYFRSIEAVLFYRAESFFARQLYDSALEDYQRIVTEFPDSDYLGDSLFRLMLIHEKTGRYEQFYQYYEHFKSLSLNVERSTYDKCNYLAGYVYLKDSKYSNARDALSDVSSESKYYPIARYLLGVVLVNQGNYSAAANIFQNLANKENYPWTDSRTAFIRNNSLLKLGYINYEQGQYQQAATNFEKISPGFESFDKALLGSAWAHMKLGDYEKTIENVNRMFGDYLASNYTYEALVLSAHTKKLIKKQDSALHDLRYVANARRALELSDKYNFERKEILSQLSILDHLEEEILERRDKHLYSITSQIRDRLQKMLLQFKSRGSSGSLVLERYEDERNSIMSQVAELDSIISQAVAQGDQGLVSKANNQRNRLLRALEVYQADKAINNVNFFVDYPLATKEGSFKYRKGMLSNVAKELETERQTIRNNLQDIQAIKTKISNASGNLNTQMDIEILEDDLKRLSSEAVRFQSWLAEHRVEELNTDFDQWADFSGFGMSDITFSSMREKEESVLQLAQNKESITLIMEQRKKELEDRLHKFEKQAQRIEQELKEEQIEVERRNKEDYFRKLYFDTDTRERKGEEKKEGKSKETNSEPVHSMLK